MIAENTILGLAAFYLILYRVVNRYDIRYVPIISLVFSIMNSSFTYYMNIKRRVDGEFENYKGYY